jgi:hypothetical protein
MALQDGKSIRDLGLTGRERFRVVNDNINIPKGTILELEVDDGSSCPSFRALSGDRRGCTHYISLRYLEVVEEESSFIQNVKDIFTMISQTAKKLLDADTRALIEAGYLNTDLTITAIGHEAMNSIMLEKNKAELVKMANEAIEEKRKNCK